MMGFELKTEYIELVKLLKVTGLCGSGGTAKVVVENEQVKVNGEVETRKRYKVRKGDRVEYDNEVVVVK